MICVARRDHSCAGLLLSLHDVTFCSQVCDRRGVVGGWLRRPVVHVEMRMWRIPTCEPSFSTSWPTRSAALQSFFPLWQVCAVFSFLGCCRVVFSDLDRKRPYLKQWLPLLCKMLLHCDDASISWCNCILLPCSYACKVFVRKLRCISVVCFNRVSLQSLCSLENYALRQLVRLDCMTR